MPNKATQMIGTSMLQLDPLIPVPKDTMAEASFTDTECFCSGRKRGEQAPDAAACCVLSQRLGDLVLFNELSSNPSVFSCW